MVFGAPITRARFSSEEEAVRGHRPRPRAVRAMPRREHRDLGHPCHMSLPLPFAAQREFFQGLSEPSALVHDLRFLLEMV